MSQEFKIEIISPDENIYSGKTIEAVLPCFEGQVTVLKDHIPLITFLRPGLIIIYGNEKTSYYVEEGTVEFSNNNLLILTSKAKVLENIDKKSLEEIKDLAKKKLNESEISDKEKYLLSYKIETINEINQ